MRDTVTVLGGFPAGKYPAPGLSERQALMSDVIDIPKSKPAQKYDAADYETILQISDEAPNVTDRRDSLNAAAVKYWDDDYAYSETTDTHNYAYKTRKITNTYTYSQNKTNNTDKYLYYHSTMFFLSDKTIQDSCHTTLMQRRIFDGQSYTLIFVDHPHWEDIRPHQNHR